MQLLTGLYYLVLLVGLAMLLLPHVDFLMKLLDNRPLRFQFGLSRLLLLLTGAGLLFSLGLVIDVVLLLLFIAYTYWTGPTVLRLVGHFAQRHPQRLSSLAFRRPLIAVALMGAYLWPGWVVWGFITDSLGGSERPAGVAYLLLVVGVNAYLWGDIGLFALRRGASRDGHGQGQDNRLPSRVSQAIVTASLLAAVLSLLCTLVSAVAFLAIGSDVRLQDLTFSTSGIASGLLFPAMAFAWVFLLGDNATGAAQLLLYGLPFGVIFNAVAGALIGYLIGMTSWGLNRLWHRYWHQTS